MKMKKSLGLFGLLAAAMCTTAVASTTFSFNSAFLGGVSSHLSDAAGVAGVDGLPYGVLIDLDGGGFANTTYDPITHTPGATIPLTSGGLATDAVLVFAADLTSDTSALLEGAPVFGVPGGPGGITSVVVNYTNGIAAGQTFEVIWFDPSLGSAGLLGSAQFDIPADTGAFLTVDQVFQGVDPVRAADDITFVPEPSAALLGAFGVLGLLRRRRS